MMIANSVILLLHFVQAFCGLSTYNTPAENDQFANFKISSAIPQNGTQLGGPIQKPVNIKKFNRQFIAFTFQGVGNAFLQFQRVNQLDYLLKIVVGGGADNSEVSFIQQNLKKKKEVTLASTIVYGITSAEASRSYWISSNDTLLSFGLCSIPNQNVVLTHSFGKPITLFEEISISTSIAYSGFWNFPSDGEILGGCSSNSVKCTNISARCIDDRSSIRFGTCSFGSNIETEIGQCQSAVPTVTTSSLRTTNISYKAVTSVPHVTKTTVLSSLPLSVSTTTKPAAASTAALSLTPFPSSTTSSAMITTEFYLGSTSAMPNSSTDAVSYSLTTSLRTVNSIPLRTFPPVTTLPPIAVSSKRINVSWSGILTITPTSLLISSLATDTLKITSSTVSTTNAPVTTSLQTESLPTTASLITHMPGSNHSTRKASLSESHNTEFDLATVSTIMATVEFVSFSGPETHSTMKVQSKLFSLLTSMTLKQSSANLSRLSNCSGVSRPAVQETIFDNPRTIAIVSSVSGIFVLGLLISAAFTRSCCRNLQTVPLVAGMIKTTDEQEEDSKGNLQPSNQLAFV